MVCVVGGREENKYCFRKFFNYYVFGGFYFLKGFIFSEAFYFYKIISSANHPLSEVSNSHFVDYHCTVT